MRPTGVQSSASLSHCCSEQSVSYGTSQQANDKNAPSSVGSIFGKPLTERFIPKCESQPLQPFSHCSCGCREHQLWNQMLQIKGKLQHKEKNRAYVLFFCTNLWVIEKTPQYYSYLLSKERSLVLLKKKIRTVRLNQIPITSVRLKPNSALVNSIA